MEISHKIIVLICLLFASQYSFSQNEKAFCKAVDNMNFNKVERIMLRLVKKNRKGQTYFNGEGSGYQINLAPSLDSITNWLKKQSCVEDAYWDKCQMKTLIYPGSSAIGVKFKTKKGIVENCFLLQEGTTGQVNIFGWRPKLSKAKKILVYKKMYECKGFIETQKSNCYPYSRDEQRKDSIVLKKLVGFWENIKLPNDVAGKGIEFRFNKQNEFELKVDTSYIYSFTEHISATALSGFGFMANWPPYNCFVNQIDDDHIQIEYECFGSKPYTITYKRVNYARGF